MAGETRRREVETKIDDEEGDRKIIKNHEGRKRKRKEQRGKGRRKRREEGEERGRREGRKEEGMEKYFHS